MSQKEARDLAEQDYDNSLKYYSNTLNEKARLTERCVSIREKVKAWQPPTKDHQELKDYMLSQLEQTLSYGCSIHQDSPKRETPEEYILRLKEEAEQGIEHHKEEYEEEVKITDEINQWLKTLRQSLPKR